jgi:hypothetical protein
MVDGRLTQQWELQAHLMAAVYNAPGRKRPVRPRQVNPYRGLIRTPEADDLDDIFGLGD